MTSPEGSPSPRTTASEHAHQFFPNMSNSRITKSPIMYVNGNAYFNPSERHELDLLRSKVSVAALHNSGERYDAPRCHPGIRVGVQADIMKWLDDVDDPKRVLWMYGSAGVGKSAIAQAIASLCYDSEPRRLAGAFFLSRTAPTESGRGDEKRLVATLVYQMTINIPCLELHVANAIAKNMFIFDLDIEVQIRELILNPLATLPNETSQIIPPKLFILDALDECSTTLGQAQIIEAFVEAMGKMPHKFPHKLLIASRPESHIKSIFAAPEISPLVRLVSLDENYKAQEDVRKFLVDGFTLFRETHPSPTIFPPIWPTDDEINTLVQRSSGQFIYASTAQKYIQDNHANPILRLQAILDLAKDPVNRLFAELDALYSHIFRQVKDLDTTLYIMCIGRCCHPPITFCESLLDLPKGGAALALQSLSLVVKVDNDQFEPYHASLNDFLEDKYRAGNFYIYSNKICVHLSYWALEYLSLSLYCHELESAKMQLIFCVSIAAQCTEYIEAAHSDTHKILSSFDLDIVFQFLSKIGNNNNNRLLYLCERLFGWVYNEPNLTPTMSQHQILAQFDEMIILQPFSPLQNWTVGQLKRFQFDKPALRQPLDYLDEIFLCRDAEMDLILRGLTGGSWVVGSVPQALTEDRIGQLMSQYCYYIYNSAWLKLIRNALLNLKSDQQSQQQGEHELGRWALFFLYHAPLEIDQYLDIQHVLGMNSSTNTAALLKEFRKVPRVQASDMLILDLYWYMEMVEEEFSCLISPLNDIEDSTSTPEEEAMDRQSSLPYTPHPSDTPLFTLALTFHTIHYIEYRDTELSLHVV